MEKSIHLLDKISRTGVEYTSYIYGGEEFALSMGKNEMPGYHTGLGPHIGVLTGARHSHLDNAGYSSDQKTLSKKKIGPQVCPKIEIFVKNHKLAPFGRAKWRPDEIPHEKNEYSYAINSYAMNLQMY